MAPQPPLQARAGCRRWLPALPLQRCHDSLRRARHALEISEPWRHGLRFRAHLLGPPSGADFGELQVGAHQSAKWRKGACRPRSASFLRFHRGAEKRAALHAAAQRRPAAGPGPPWAGSLQWGTPRRLMARPGRVCRAQRAASLCWHWRDGNVAALRAAARHRSPVGLVPPWAGMHRWGTPKRTVARVERGFRPMRASSRCSHWGDGGVAAQRSSAGGSGLPWGGSWL